MGNKGFPKDLRYAAEGEPSVLRGYVDYLSGYLGIKPKVIHPLYLQCHTENLIQEKLHELHCEDALEQDIALSLIHIYARSSSSNIFSKIGKQSKVAK